ncbi:hypothetical protein RUND412_000328 [Rhizina undulata]
MLSSISRHSSYICLQCRFRFLRQAAGIPRQIAALSRTVTSTATLKAHQQRKKEASEDNDMKMDTWVSSILQGTFGEAAAGSMPISQSYIPPYWEFTGLRSLVIETVLKAFPNVSRLTESQRKLLSYLTAGFSVAIRDKPGTGKSFAIAIWLLSLQRSTRDLRSPMEREKNAKPRLRPTTTALVIAPSIDLVKQYYSIICECLKHTGSPTLMKNTENFVQALYRTDDPLESTEQIERLREYPFPHIIVATPTILLDILDETANNSSLLDLDRLKAVVVDEMDSAIAKMNYFRDKDKSNIWKKEPPVPVEILMDYIFKRRRAAIVLNKPTTPQPQLVFPSSTLSPNQIQRFVKLQHNVWLNPNITFDAERRTMRNNFETRNRNRSCQIKCVQDADIQPGFSLNVADHLDHYMVAYDASSGFMRDAPLPSMVEWNDDKLKKELDVSEDKENKIAKKETKSLDEIILWDWQTRSSHQKCCGYPTEIAAEALHHLLEHDKWPKNAIAFLGPDANQKGFKAELEAMSITAKLLRTEIWDKDAETEGRAPIGRTDLLIGKGRDEKEITAGNKEGTTVWITNLSSCRGIDTPGIYHGYVLHRLDKARDYITYCGRIARWPFARMTDEIEDPRAAGRDRRTRGKIVSLILEEHLVPMGDGVAPTSNNRAIVACDGSEEEKQVWKDEGLKLAKIGCIVKPFFGQSEVEQEVREEKEAKKEEDVDVKTPKSMNDALRFLDEAAEKKDVAEEVAEEEAMEEAVAEEEAVEEEAVEEEVVEEEAVEEGAVEAGAVEEGAVEEEVAEEEVSEVKVVEEAQVAEEEQDVHETPKSL